MTKSFACYTVIYLSVFVMNCQV